MNATTERYYSGLHTHRHGVSCYILKAERELTIDDFIAFLGDDYEDDRDDEYLDFEEQSPIEIE